MKRTPLLHAELSEVIARLGHGDLLVIGDAGLPIPEFTDGPRRIDLAVSANVPRLLDVLDAVLAEMQVEGAAIAAEMTAASPELRAQLLGRLASTPVTTLSHEAFKQATRGARAIVRTGEFTPYANVILRSGVVF